MPWTIWPALAVLWGVCWMFYDDGNFWNLINVSETNLQPNTEEDLRQDETVLGRNGSLSGDLHSGPIPINESPVFDDFSIFDYVPSYVPSYVPGETSHRRATNWPHDDLVANDKQPAAIPGNDDIDYPGLIMTIGEHATLSSAVPQTQLNLQAEQQASLMLQPTTGISEGQENSHTAVAGLPFECSVASCDKTFTTKSGLTAHSKRHDKPFICDECPDRFGSKKELDRHQSSKHSLERPFVCSWPQCERSRRGWPRKDNYDRHVRDVHKGQHEPTAPLLIEGDVPSGGSAISRKRQREDSDDSESDLRSELRKRDERIRELEQELGETRRSLNETRGSLNDTKIVLNEYKELCTHYKEQAKIVQEKGA
ncbi:hypothetical protein MGN70_012111 [Eutypa lata]|nr:hypothetical protein MGN70_012111 [Eutypa lata]